MPDQDNQKREPKSHVFTNGWFRKSEDLSLWRTYRIDLVTELERSTMGTDEKNTVKSLLASQAWEALYEAEQRLAQFRDADDIAADWSRRVVEGEKLGVSSLASLKASYDKQGATPGSQRAIYLKLLDDLHFRYSKRRLDREKRKETANWLNVLGIWLCLAGVIATAVGYFFATDIWSFISNWHILYVVWCGMLGAYFSRSVSMQGKVATLDYDLLVADYSKWSIFQRLIIGAIAAFLIYLLISGNLLAGDLFPQAIVTVNEPKNSQAWLKLAPIGLSKLLVWSVIAGFSERLLPDQLDRITSTAQAQKKVS